MEDGNPQFLAEGGGPRGAESATVDRQVKDYKLPNANLPLCPYLGR